MTAKDLWYKPKLIEVALPLEDINRESAREKSIRHGHPSTLHLWWARRPLAACRAVLFAQLVDDPSAHPDKFPTEEDQAVERKRLHGIISRLVVWENIHDEKLLREAHEEILKSTGGNPPPILDPFAGGGSIPLEAQRLGLEAHASDLNPVAVLINKALIEIPPKWAGHKPVFPGAADERLSWPGATGLAEDVRRYGKWMRDEAEKRIGHLYPKVNVGGVDCTVIAWIWARTVTCPNPACAGTMPLVEVVLAWQEEGQGAIRRPIPVPDGKRVRFEIGGPDGSSARRDGWAHRRDMPALWYTSSAWSTSATKARPVAWARNSWPSSRRASASATTLPPTEEHEKAARRSSPPTMSQKQRFPTTLGYLRLQSYGMRTWSDLFTNRQLTALTTFSDCWSREARQRIISRWRYGLTMPMRLRTYLAFVVTRWRIAIHLLHMGLPAPKRNRLRNTVFTSSNPHELGLREGIHFRRASSGNIADAYRS